MITKNILLITLVFSVLSSCQNESRAPKIASKSASVDDLIAKKIDTIDCSNDASNMNFNDLQDQRVNLCSLFDETSSDLFVIQFVGSECSECIESSHIFAEEMMTRNSKKITHIIISDDSLTNDELTDLSKNSLNPTIWLKDVENNFSNLSDEVNLFTSENNFLLSRFASKLIEGNQTLTQVISNASNHLGLNIDDDQFDLFEWNGNQNQSSNLWNVKTITSN